MTQQSFQTGVQNSASLRKEKGLCFGGQSRAMHFCLQVGSELLEWDLEGRGGVGLGWVSIPPRLHQ